MVFEFAHPGFILPGTVGLLSLAVALYAFQILPVNAFGVVLILAGAASMIAEAFLFTFGVLGIVGFVSFLAGSFILFHTGNSRTTLAWPLLGTLSLAMAGCLIGLVGMAVKARRLPVESGPELLMTQGGEAFEDFVKKGRVRINSEIWWAIASVPVRKGQKVRVTGKNGLTLFVTPATEE